MSTIANFPLPDVGEGLTEAEIVSWKVKPGDTVKVNQIIVEIETAKSLVELPCPFAGTVAELFYKEGDTAEVGKPIISVTVADGAVTSAVAVAEQASSVHQAVADVAASVSTDEKQPNLVGYGVSHSLGGSRRRKAGAVAPATISAPPVVETPAGEVIAKPPVRKLAKDLNVDLSQVTGTGPGGEITRDNPELV